MQILVSNSYCWVVFTLLAFFHWDPQEHFSLHKNPIPLFLWFRLLPQATITLNLIYGSKLNHTIYAQEQINIPHDYNATPMAPLGTVAILHLKSGQGNT